MPLFLSTFTNKVDKKGRVSIPSIFRKVLINEDKDCNSIVVYPSFLHPCIEVCSIKKMQEIAEELEEMDIFSEEREAFAMSILGGSMELVMDPEGRIKLSEDLLDIADILDKASFVGKGQRFEIWNPHYLQEHMKKSREIARKMRMKFGCRKKSKNLEE